MSKIAIVTDTTSYLSKEWMDQYHIHHVPLSVNFGSKSYREGLDLTTEEFYKQLETEKELPTTSQPAIGDFIELYERLAEEYDEAIAIHLSSGISGTYSTSISAANMVNGIKVEVIDSEIACYGLGFMVLEAAEMSRQGKAMQEIKERVEWIVQNMRGYFIVDDLAHLHRGGRLNAAQFLVGSMLKIKPVIYFKEKKLEPFEKIRTKKKAIDRILQLLEMDVNEGTKIKLSVVQANAQEEAEEILNHILQTYSQVEGNISEFGPVIGTHVGPGTLGFVWYKTEN